MKTTQLLGHVFSAAVVAFLVAAPTVEAQTPYRVTDLGGPVTFHWDDWFGTNEIVEANGVMFFFQNDGSSGRELWRSDGTTLGTFMLRDLCLGSCGSRTWYPGPIAAVGDHVFFAANDGTHGVELWVTDGTALGTRIVLDLVPGWGSSYPRMLTAASGQLIFVAESVGSPAALWRSDGTPKGTYRISPAGVSFREMNSTLLGQGLLYLFNAGSSGEFGLWRTDGTEAGTILLAPVSCYWTYLDRRPNATVLPNGELLFSADDGVLGFELWRSDGTAAGTALLADLRTGSNGSEPRQFALLGSEAVFLADSNPPGGGSVLWRSDGSLAGTLAVPLPPGAQAFAVRRQFAVDDGRYFFTGQDAASGLEPWVFDGISADRFADIAPGPASSLEFDPFGESFFAIVDGVLVLSADDGVHGRELWRSDGTAGGTFRLSDLGPGPQSMSILMWDGSHHPSVIADRLYLFEHQSPNGYRLLRTDGVTVGPEIVRVIDAQTSLFEPVARDRGSLLEFGLGHVCFEGAGSRLLFERSQWATVAPELWSSDGSSAGTNLAVAGVDPGRSLNPCHGLGDRLIYFDEQEAQPAVRSLSTSGAAPEELVPDFGPGTLPPFLDLDGAAIFETTSGLFRSDATAEGTTLLATINDGFSFNRIALWGKQVLRGGSALFLTVEDTTTPRVLTPPGILGVTEIAPLTDRVLFQGTDAAHGTEIWVSYGEKADASLVADARPGPAGSIEPTGGPADLRIPLLAALNSVAVYAANDGIHGSELWVSDGTPLGTHLLKDIYPGDYPSTPRNLTRFADRVFFGAESELEGLELWATDGTYEGTVLVKDIAPGGASSIPDDLVVRDGVLYFSAWSPNYGREAWKSDGTSAGTIRITDIAPGPKSSSPQRFARAGNRLFMSATDQVHGYELWAISDDGSIPLFLDGFENESTVRWSSTAP